VANQPRPKIPDTMLEFKSAIITSKIVSQHRAGRIYISPYLPFTYPVNLYPFLSMPSFS
jgi:hypothetical protein